MYKVLVTTVYKDTLKTDVISFQHRSEAIKARSLLNGNTNVINGYYLSTTAVILNDD